MRARAHRSLTFTGSKPATWRYSIQPRRRASASDTQWMGAWSNERVLGHRKITTTLDTYAQEIRDAEQRREARQLTEAAGPKWLPELEAAS
jgi:hypothetical protein